MLFRSRCVEEGARVFISDAHERRLGEAAQALTALAQSDRKKISREAKRERAAL